MASYPLIYGGFCCCGCRVRMDCAAFAPDQDGTNGYPLPAYLTTKALAHLSAGDSIDGQNYAFFPGHQTERLKCEAWITAPNGVSTSSDGQGMHYDAAIMTNDRTVQALYEGRKSGVGPMPSHRWTGRTRRWAQAVHGMGAVFYPLCEPDRAGLLRDDDYNFWRASIRGETVDIVALEPTCGDCLRQAVLDAPSEDVRNRLLTYLMGQLRPTTTEYSITLSGHDDVPHWDTFGYSWHWAYDLNECSMVTQGYGAGGPTGPRTVSLITASFTLSGGAWSASVAVVESGTLAIHPASKLMGRRIDVDPVTGETAPVLTAVTALSGIVDQSDVPVYCYYDYSDNLQVLRYNYGVPATITPPSNPPVCSDSASFSGYTSVPPTAIGSWTLGTAHVEALSSGTYIKQSGTVSRSFVANRRNDSLLPGITDACGGGSVTRVSGCSKSVTRYDVDYYTSSGSRSTETRSITGGSVVAFLSKTNPDAVYLGEKIQVSTERTTAESYPVFGPDNDYQYSHTIRGWPDVGDPLWCGTTGGPIVNAIWQSGTPPSYVVDSDTGTVAGNPQITIYGAGAGFAFDVAPSGTGLDDIIASGELPATYDAAEGMVAGNYRSSYDAWDSYDGELTLVENPDLQFVGWL